MSETSKEVAVAGSPARTGSAVPFQIGDRIYWVGRDDRRPGYRIVANGDLVDYASALHYGEIGAFQRITARLAAIERDWAQSPNEKLSHTAPTTT